MMNDFGLTNETTEEILSILRNRKVIQKAVIFGSRARNTFKVGSDIDLAIWQDTGSDIVAKLKSDFEESSLPYFFDVLDYRTVSDEKLKKEIDRWGKIFYIKGWKMTTLGEVMETANTGLDAIKRAPIVSEDTGVKCFRIQDASQSKEYKRWGFTKVTEQNYKKFKLLKGDILIARTGNSIGVNFLVKENTIAVFNNGIIRLRVSDKTVYDFLYKIISSISFDNYIQSIAYGTSTQPNMQINSLLNFNFLLPPLPEQRAIAAVLSSLDDKIELLREQNKTLEATAQAIFKEWFVNYRFPGVGKMIDSELGNIPEGWRVGKLGELVDFIVDNRGKTPPVEEKNTNAFPLVEINSMVSNSRCINLNVCKKYVSQEIYNCWFRKGHPTKGDVLISTVGSIGEVCLIFDEKICIAQNVIALRSFGIGEYLYQFLLHMKNSTVGLDIGGVQPSIKVPHLLNLEIVIPTKYLIEKYIALIKSISTKISINNSQIQTLSTLRDTLLPKLMKGEVRVEGI